MSDLLICPVCGHQSKHWSNIHICTPAPEAPRETASCRCGRNPRDIRYGICYECVTEGKVAAPEAPRETPKCDGDGGYESNGPEGWVGCNKCGGDCRAHEDDTPPVAELSLDFEEAEEAIGSTFYEDRGNVEALFAALNDQLRSIVAAQVAKAEEQSNVEFLEMLREARNLYGDMMEAERSRGQELRRLVRELQGTPCADPMSTSIRFVPSLKEHEAVARLRAFDLGPEDV